MSLSTGAIAEFLGQKKQPPTDRATFQILKSRVVQPADAREKKIRLCISDGVNSYSLALLMVTDGNPPPDHSIIQVIAPEDSCGVGSTNSIVNTNGKCIWVIRNYRVVTRHSEVIGEPVPLKVQAEAEDDERTPERRSAPPSSTAAPPPKRAKAQEGTPGTSSGRSGGLLTGLNTARRQLFNDDASRDVMQPTHLIKDLNPYQNKFKIKARVVKKSDIRSWSNSGGRGQVFDVTLKDSSGEIKATGFNDEAVHFHTLFEEGKVYMVSTATIKPANKNFNATDHNYELSFHKGTTVSHCQEASSQDVPRLQHNLKTVNDINDGCQDKDTVDFVGIVADVADVVHFTARSGKELTKREVRVVDDSGGGFNDIAVTLWGDQAEMFDNTNTHKALLARRCTVGEWNNKKSLSVSFSGTVTVDPEGCDEADRLKDWFARENATNGGVAHRLQEQGNGAGSRLRAQGTLVTLADIKAVSSGMETSQTFAVEAQFTNFFLDKLTYKACQECRKKVTEVKDSVRCEKCDRTLSPDQINFRYMAQATLADFTDYHYVTLWNDGGEAVFGYSARELKKMEEEDHTGFIKAINAAKFKLFKIQVKAVNDSYQNERRLKLQVITAEPVERTDQERLKRMRAEMAVIEEELGM